MSKHDPFSDLREAAEKMGLPSAEVAHILRIAEENQRENERRADGIWPVTSNPNNVGKPYQVRGVLPLPEPENARAINSRSIQYGPPISERDLYEPQPVPQAILWCEQCDQRVARVKALSCRSQWCKARGKL